MWIISLPPGGGSGYAGRMSNLLQAAKTEPTTTAKWDEWIQVAQELIPKGKSMQEVDDWLTKRGEHTPRSFSKQLSRRLAAAGTPVRELKKQKRPASGKDPRRARRP